MATYHLTLKNGKSHTAEQHADYILREGRFSSGERAEELVYKASNLPRWAMSPSAFFACADLYERVNARAYCEFEVALPNELNHKDNRKLVDEFVKKHIGNNKVWTYAIHSKPATFDEGEEQIHAHIMFCERTVTDGMDKAKPANQFFKRYNAKSPEKGGYQKDRALSGDRKQVRENLKAIRESWETMINDAYKAHGIDEQVSCKTLKAQQEDAIEAGDTALADYFDRDPQEHLGPALAYKTKKILEENGFDQEHIEESLKKVCEMSEKAFILVMDKIKKAHKAVVLRAKRQAELEEKEKAYSEKKLAELYANSEVVPSKTIRKDFITLLKSVDVQMEYNDHAINSINNCFLTPQQIADKALSVVTGGRSETMQQEEETLKYLQGYLKEVRAKYPTKQDMPPDVRKEANKKYKIFKALRENYLEISEYVHTYPKTEAGVKWYSSAKADIMKQQLELGKERAKLVTLHKEYVELRQHIIDTGKTIDPNMFYRVRGKYEAPAMGRGQPETAIIDTKSNVDNLMRNIISAGNEHLKRNKMTVDLRSRRQRRNDGWEM